MSSQTLCAFATTVSLPFSSKASSIRVCQGFLRGTKVARTVGQGLDSLWRGEQSLLLDFGKVLQVGEQWEVKD